jgi:metal-responsive CopG/Arc/MetJ family transcriptional regulator
MSDGQESAVCGITKRMKLTVSIPNEIFAKAEAYAKKTKTSRNKLYPRALTEYLSWHSPNRVRANMNRVVATLSHENNEFRHRAIRRIVERNDW